MLFSQVKELQQALKDSVDPVALERAQQRVHNAGMCLYVWPAIPVFEALGT